ncbi:hypothetical protein, partial [Streptomyces mirabilis]|uniref:hypothetical protein n=1 Tax=Streptomyces mirabilis TaxID=68239 RepID=UPI003F4D1B4A
MRGAAAHGAGLAVDETGGEFRGDALKTLFLQIEPVDSGVRRAFTGGEGPGVGGVRVPGELVALPGRPEPRLGGIAPLGELFRTGGGLLRGLDACLELRAGHLPGGEPALGVLADVLVLALLAVQGGALPGEFAEPALRPAGRLQAAEFLGRLARRRREPGRTGSGVGVRQGETRACLGRGRAAVFGLGGVTQVERGGDRIGLAPGTEEPAVDGVSLTLRRGEILAIVGENGS